MKNIIKYTVMGVVYYALIFIAVPTLISMPSTLMVLLAILIVLGVHLFAAYLVTKHFTAPNAANQVNRLLRDHEHRFTEADLSHFEATIGAIRHRYHRK